MRKYKIINKACQHLNFCNTKSESTNIQYILSLSNRKVFLKFLKKYLSDAFFIWMMEERDMYNNGTPFKSVYWGLNHPTNCKFFLFFVLIGSNINRNRISKGEGESGRDCKPWKMVAYRLQYEEKNKQPQNSHHGLESSIDGTSLLLPWIFQIPVCASFAKKHFFIGSTCQTVGRLK